MNSKWDYILKEDEYKRILFRLYPNNTYIHCFNIPPNDWNDVYKEYYSWGIIFQYKGYDGKVEDSTRVMYMPCDECSNVSVLHNIIRDVVEKQEDYNYPTLGQPAADWSITIKKGVRKWDDNKSYEYYIFRVFDNYYGNGYTFELDRTKTEEFANWLEQMNNRAFVKCSCPI